MRRLKTFVEHQRRETESRIARQKKGCPPDATSLSYLEGRLEALRLMSQYIDHLEEKDILLNGTASAFSPHRSDATHRSRTPQDDRALLEVAAYLDEHAQPSDEIFVLGGEPVIYYLADRKAPTKYFFWLFHAPRWDAILHSTGSSLESFKNNPPEWFLYRQSSPRIPELEKFMYANYEKVAEVGDYEIARWAR